MKQRKILSFGALNIDHVYRVDHLVRPGETISSQGYQQFAGGKGFNQSIALARAGAAPYHAGRIGKDGEWLRALLEENGVDVANVTVADESSGHALIQVDESGENAIILFGGSNQSIEPEQIDAVLENFQEGDILLIQNEISHVSHLISQAGKQGLTILLNPAPISKDVLEYELDWVDFFIINEPEGEGLTGFQSPQDILKDMAKRYPDSAVVLTLGAQGAIYAKGGEQIQVDALSVQAVDTTAAGDTFIGYFLASMVQERSIQASMERAAKAAAICVTRPGASSSIPWADEVDETNLD